MSREQYLNDGPSKLRFVILGAIVLIFGAGLLMLMNSSKKPATKAKPAQTAQADDASAMQASAPLPAESGVVDAAAEVQGADASLAAAPAETVPSPSESAAVTESVASTEADAGTSAQLDAMDHAAADAPGSQFEVAEPATDLAMNDAGSADAESYETNNEANVARPAVRPPPPPAIGALRPWWRRDVSKQGFEVQYVGQAASENALVFRFSKNLSDVETAAREIRITDEAGNAASGNWEKGQNGYVAVYRGVSPGRYTVHIDGDLKSANGKVLGESLQGPVYVQ